MAGLKKNFLSIEGIRAWMAWWVVLMHSYDIVGRGMLPARLESLIVRPDAPVSVFIIISGFVITHLLLKAEVDYRAFITRRFLRLFPIYAACIVLMVVIKAVASDALIDMPWPPGLGDGRAERYALVADTFWLRLMLHLSMLQGLVPEEWLPYITASFLTPTWTLSLEWQFYLIAPLLLGLLKRGLAPFCSACAVLLVLGLVAQKGLLGTYPMPSMLLLAIHLFLIGIASRLFLESDVRIPMNAGVFLVLGGVVMLWVQSLVALIWFTIFTFVLLENQRLEPSRWVDGLMRLSVTNRAVCYAGKISYSTYLIHYPVFHVAMLCWSGTQDATRPEMLAFLWSMLPLVLLASAASYRVIEQPFMQIGRRRSSSVQAQAL